MTSLRARLLLSTSAVMAIFMLGGGLAVERAFREGALQAQQDKLQGLIYSLLGAAESSADDQLLVAEFDLPDPRLRQPLSGLEARISNAKGERVWASPSHYEALPANGEIEVGQWHFFEHPEPPRFVLSLGVRWLGLDAEARRYTITVFEDRSQFQQQIRRFRAQLFFWFGAAAAGLLITLLLVLAWMTRPLGRLARELRAVELGDGAEISKNYPAELQPLTGALNTMIRSERRQLARYRDALADLAHSLKTPLAVLHGLREENALPSAVDQSFAEQLQRIQDISDHQLKRAATAGRRVLTGPVDIHPIVERLLGALRKVHADKNARFSNRLPPDLKLRADSGDLYELLGNLLDNAARFAVSRLIVSARRSESGLCLSIEDDGPGFPPNAEALLDRGVRADSQHPGQGIGLAVVAQMVAAYDGELQLQRSADLGGAAVTVCLPLR